MKCKILYLMFFVFSISFSNLAAQTDAPNNGETAYYKQIIVVDKNGKQSNGDNTGQFITFTRKGCYDSDIKGHSVHYNKGFMYYKSIDRTVHIYEGDSYWGKAFYGFSSNFNRLNIKTEEGITFVYEKATAPADVLTSAKIYVKPKQEKNNIDNPVVPTWSSQTVPNNVIAPNNTQWELPTSDYTAELQRLQNRYNDLKRKKEREEQNLIDTYRPVIDSGIARGHFGVMNSIRQTIREYERQMEDIQQQARRYGGSVY